MQSMKLAIFKLGEEEYGMDIMDVNIIEKYIPTEPIENLPKNLKGIIHLRGDVIPVYSLRRKFGLPDIEPNDDTRYVITTSNGILMAYEVDKMIEIIEFEKDQLFETPSVVKNKDTSYMNSVASADDRLIINLNHDGLLAEDEQEIIETEIKSKAIDEIKNNDEIKSN